MSIKLIARDLYRLTQEVEELERQVPHPVSFLPHGHVVGYFGGILYEQAEQGVFKHTVASFKEAVGKRPSTALSSSLVIAAYFSVRLIPRDFGCLASGDFTTASNRSNKSAL